MGDEARSPELVDHLFRHHYGRLVAGLTRIFGAERLDLVEDVVQDALMKALKVWPFEGIPERPDAWLVKVARNLALDAVRHQQMADRHREAIERWARQTENATSTDHEIADDSLRMIFTCCHPALPVTSQVALTLKTLCGFGVAEIGAALLQKEATVAQRLSRAKGLLQRECVAFEVPGPADLAERVGAVLDVLYLLFNEGYSAHVGDDLVRGELVSEALRLGMLLAETGVAAPPVHALLALMHFLAARLPARINDLGDILTLPEQDRSLWDRGVIGRGFTHFQRSLSGDAVTCFHIEAAIASLHAMAPTYEATDWDAILARYDALLELREASVVRLNRAIAVAKVSGVEAGLAALEPLLNHGDLDRYHLLFAVKGQFLWIAERREEAVAALLEASNLTSMEVEQRLLTRRAESCRDGAPPPRF